VAPQEWDRLVVECGGSFFHCHAHTVCESAHFQTTPLFLKLRDQHGQPVGVASAALSAPRRWPFSRYCKEALLFSLPATKNPSPEGVVAALQAVEGELRRRGVFRIHIASLHSPHSEQVLSALGYSLLPRHEFILGLARPLEAVWDGMRSERRSKIRKAIKAGVKSVEDNTEAGLRLLRQMHVDALARKGIHVPADDHTGVIARTLFATGRGGLLVSYEGQTPVAAVLFGVFDGMACTLLSGSSPAGNKCAAPAHARWTLIELARARGARVLNLGGAAAAKGGGGGGLYTFKRDFGAEALFRPAGSKMLSRRGALLDRLRGWLRRLRKPALRPLPADGEVS
jgi:hypothetical protein